MVEENTGAREPWMVFPGVQKSTWSYDEAAAAWYFHRFYKFPPDLNTSHPDVQAEILKIMGFWIQLGVSMDASTLFALQSRLCCLVSVLGNDKALPSFLSYSRGIIRRPLGRALKIEIVEV